MSVFQVTDPPEERIPPLVFRFPKNGLTSAASTPVVSSLASADVSSSTKRKYEKRSVPRATTPPPNMEREKEKEREKELLRRKQQEAIQEEEEEEEEEPAKPRPEVSSLKNWTSLIPSMEELKLRVERAEKETKAVVDKTAGETRKDPTKVQLIKNFRRPILVLPYLENPTGPDFLLHKYPNSLQYYSEDNFRFGEKRPTE